MVQEAIIILLKQMTGLNPDTVGTEAIGRAIRQRMLECSITDMALYLKRLHTCEQELHQLIEAVIVPETWFFRDEFPFTYLVHYVTAEWLKAHPHRTLRVLSAACSTGEEPYSIAMALLDAGVEAQRFHIDAVDISLASLQKARHGVYGAYSFRGEGLKYRELYFETCPEGYRVCESLRNTVAFAPGNVLDRQFLSDEEPYDIIFCRNLLIYFHDVAKAHALAALDQLLSPTGVLFVGYAETGLLLDAGYVATQFPRSFAYRKADAGRDRAKPLCVREPPPAPAVPFAVSPELSKPPETLLSALGTVKQLADQGVLDEAAELCAAVIGQHGPSAQAYVLLGLIHHAGGNEKEAEQCFHRTLYLQSDHYEALIHLALLLEKRGDTAGAAVMRQRAGRAQASAPNPPLLP